MRARTAVAALAAVMALLCPAQAVAARSSPSAPMLLAGTSRLNDQLALLRQGSSGFGLSGNRALFELRFENGDGYAISVLAFDQTVALSVTRSHGHRKRRNRVSTTTYLAHGKVTPTSIAASFGDRGRIAVRFRPSGREVRATRRAGCKRSSGRVLAHLGVFAGALRFRGEDGYTSAEARRARGRSIDFRALLACLVGSAPGRQAVLPPPRSPFGFHLPGSVAAPRGTIHDVPSVPTHPSQKPKSTTLFANGKVALSRTIFAAQVRGESRAQFVAIDEDSEGSIGIVRFAFVRAPAPTFAFDDTLASVAVRPPPPFSGAGALDRDVAGAKGWTGPLAISFLGAPHVPLAGSPFKVLLAQSW